MVNKKYYAKSHGISMTDPEWDIVTKEAARLDINASRFVRRALKEYFRNHKKEKQHE